MSLCVCEYYDAIIMRDLACVTIIFGGINLKVMWVIKLAGFYITFFGLFVCYSSHSLFFYTNFNWIFVIFHLTFTSNCNVKWICIFFVSSYLNIERTNNNNEIETDNFTIVAYFSPLSIDTPQQYTISNIYTHIMNGTIDKKLTPK